MNNANKSRIQQQQQPTIRNKQKRIKTNKHVNKYKHSIANTQNNKTKYIINKYISKIISKIKIPTNTLETSKSNSQANNNKQSNHKQAKHKTNNKQ